MLLEQIFPIFYALSGFLMKLSDDEYDEKSNKGIAIILGLISGLFMGVLAISSRDASYIFLGILIGNLIGFKVDGVHHIASMLVFAVLFIVNIFFNGWYSLSIITLLICIVGALVDEIYNDNPKLKNKYVIGFFEYRCFMKLVILVLSLLGLYQCLTGFTIHYMDFLGISSIVLFILFEISYELAGFVFKKYLI